MRNDPIDLPKLKVVKIKDYYKKLQSAEDFGLIVLKELVFDVFSISIFQKLINS